jgi:hypothetical protein
MRPAAAWRVVLRFMLVSASLLTTYADPLTIRQICAG